MKTQLIVMSDKVILVADESPKAGDFTLTYPDHEIVQLNQSTHVLYDKKIIAGLSGQPIIDLGSLSEQDCEKISYFDVNRIACLELDDDSPEAYNGFVQGFLKALSLKRYNEADMKMAFLTGMRHVGRNLIGTNEANIINGTKSFLESLSKPRIFDVETEIIDNKIKILKIL